MPAGKADAVKQFRHKMPGQLTKDRSRASGAGVAREWLFGWLLDGYKQVISRIQNTASQTKDGAKLIRK
jgi:hypothetical protein